MTTSRNVVPAIESLFDNEGGLRCPLCHECYCLHHHRTEVFDRGEDDEEGLHVDVSRGRVTTTMDISANPSARRDGITIHFWCEHCNCDDEEAGLGLGNLELKLHIAQHKGTTYIHWEVIELPPKRIGIAMIPIEVT